MRPLPDTLLVWAELALSPHSAVARALAGGSGGRTGEVPNAALHLSAS